MEKKTNFIIGLGALVFILPFLGLPQSFDNVLYILAGLVLIGIGISARLSLKNKNIPKETETFKENGRREGGFNDR